MKRTAQKTVAGILAAIAAICGTTMLWHLGYSAWSQADSGSSGIGAVSVGLVLTVALFASVVLFAELGVDDDLGRRLIATSLNATIPIAGFTLAAQFLVLAVILAFFATQKAA